MIVRIARVLAIACALTAAGCSGKAAGGDAASTGSPATAATPAATAGDPGRGAVVFRANCAACHTTDGSSGGVGPSLQHEKQRKNEAQTIAWIESPDPPMPKLYPQPLSEKDVEDVAAYVQSL